MDENFAHVLRNAERLSEVLEHTDRLPKHVTEREVRDAFYAEIASRERRRFQLRRWMKIQRLIAMEVVRREKILDPNWRRSFCNDPGHTDTYGISLYDKARERWPGKGCEECREDASMVDSGFDWTIHARPDHPLLPFVDVEEDDLVDPGEYEPIERWTRWHVEDIEYPFGHRRWGSAEEREHSHEVDYEKSGRPSYMPDRAR